MYLFKQIYKKKIIFLIVITICISSSSVQAATKQPSEKIVLISGETINTDNFNEEKGLQFCQSFEKELKKAETITGKDNITIRLLNKEEILPTNNYLVIKDVEELIQLLEQEEINNNILYDNEYHDNIAYTANKSTNKSSTKTVTRKCTRGIALKMNLEADITYNTSTNVITKVANRHFYFSGLTLGFKATDRTYKTSYSSTKKTCTVTCNYVEIAEIVTPVGAVEVTRHKAYQEFKWNKSKDVHDVKGGYK